MDVTQVNKKKQDKLYKHVVFGIRTAFGMFVFGIVALAQDGFGFIPLEYSICAGVFLFGLSIFLHLRGIYVPGLSAMSAFKHNGSSSSDMKMMDFPSSSNNSYAPSAFNMSSPSFSQFDTPATNPTPNFYSTGSGSYGNYSGSHNPSTY